MDQMIANTATSSEQETVSHQERLKASATSHRSVGTKKPLEEDRARGGNAAALRAADWLSLAAAPTFALMALLTGVLGGGPLDALCATVQGASPLSGMVPMYVLMSAFHSAPWLKLISSRWGDARQTAYRWRRHNKYDRRTNSRSAGSV
jgi:hypothetical protein